MRDYQYVFDHCEAIDLVLHKGQIGEIYNVGTGTEMCNIDMTRLVLELLDKPESLIRFVNDRLGHDLRYSLNSDKARALGWRPSHRFEDAMKKTISWYVNNEWWWRQLSNKN